MSNEKKENVSVEQKSVLVREVILRRCWFDGVDDDGQPFGCEYLEGILRVAGESCRFKLDPSSSKLLRVLMKQAGYPLYDKAGNIVKEDVYVFDI